MFGVQPQDSQDGPASSNTGASNTESASDQGSADSTSARNDGATGNNTAGGETAGGNSESTALDSSGGTGTSGNEPSASGASTNETADSKPADQTPPTDPSPVQPAPTGARAVGADTCPPGPLGAPLSANPQATLVAGPPPGHNGFSLMEGPVWTGDALYVSQVGSNGSPPDSDIHRFVPGQGMEYSVIADTGSNGLALSADGSLLAGTHDIGAISRFQLNGARSPVGEQTFEGNRFNSPNDLTARTDGNIYFTDPAFQAPGNPQNATRVYRIDPQGQVSVVDQMDRPNGIALSPDGSRLYVTSGQFDRALVQYPLDASGAPGGGIPLNVRLDTPDGMAVDCAGNIYTTEHNSRIVRVINPDGQQILEFTPNVDGNLTNLAFGGADRRTLFLTTTMQGAGGGLYAIQASIPGLPY